MNQTPYLYSLDTPINCQYTVAPAAGNSIFHIHNHCELFFLKDGEISYFVEQSCYHMKSGDLIMFSGLETHKALNLQPHPFTRMVLHIAPEYVSQFNTSQTNLLACFHHRKPGVDNCISLTPDQREEFSLNFNRIQKHLTDPVYGSELYLSTSVIQLLLLVNSCFRNQDNHAVELISLRSSYIMNYISNHLSEPLTLDMISREVALDKNYLCHLFKQETGSTIFQYIKTKRIALAKNALENGQSVTEACHSSGFNDYTHFIRTFRQITGYTPLSYQKQVSIV